MRKLANEELGRLEPEGYRKADKFDLVVVLDNLRSMHNVGAAFRTADAFRIRKLWLTGITACPPHREIHKAALGATETVDWEYEQSPATAVKRLQDEGYTLLAIEQAEGSQLLDRFVPDSQKKYALVFGNEVFGVSDEVMALCDGSLEIPQFGTKHSLNVSVSVGVLVWDFFQKSKPSL
ncbi:MAG: RNA methyltransferase [Cyclobacteriaceae bacterium]|nr:RNA methyltransferase [Cyclobacteriaceae bacterium]